MNGVVTISDSISEKKYIPLEVYEDAVNKLCDEWMLKHILDLISISNESSNYSKHNPYFKMNNSLKFTIEQFLEPLND